MPVATKEYLETALKSGSEYVVVKERKLDTIAVSHHKTYDDARKALNKSKGATAIYRIREWLNFWGK